MEVFKSKKEKALMMFMCVAIYFVSYITRINYTAVMVEMDDSGWLAEKWTSIAVTINSIAYGAGQLVSGYFGDKIKPYKLSFMGLMVTAVINMAVPFCAVPGVNIALWTVNGVAQAFMWPPLVRIMATYFNESEYKATCGLVACGSGAATLLMYLCSPLLIAFVGWKASFFIPSVTALVFGLLWLFYFKKMGKRVSWDVEEKPKNKAQDKTEEAPKNKFTGTVLFLLGMVMLGIVLQGILRDGMSNWMPTFIKDSFNVASELAILTGVVLPVFHIICNNLSLTVNRKWIKNELTCTGLFFSVATVTLGLLAVFGGNIAVAVSAFAVAVGCMHGINVIFTAIVPRYFLKYGKVSLMSGLLNSCTYIGGALATIGSSVISKYFGWGTVVIVWTVVAACGIFVCFTVFKLWGKFKEN